MAEQKNTLNNVKDSFELNAYEAKVYTALLSRGIAAAGELSDISGVPRSRCYDVLECLEKKGFVFQKIGKPIKFIPVHPEQVLETLKKNAKLEENRLLALYDSIENNETFSELKKLYETGINYIDNTELSHSIQGRQNINLFLKDMLGRAKTNVLIHTTKEGAKRKLKILKKSVKNKVPVTIHAPLENFNTKEKNIMFENNSNGMRFVHIDEDELLFFTSPIDTHPSNESAVWIKSKFTANAIKGFLN